MRLHLALLCRDTGVRFHTVQVRYHLFSRYIEKEVIPWCREHGVGILAHSVLGKGLCTGKLSSSLSLSLLFKL